MNDRLAYIYRLDTPPPDPASITGAYVRRFMGYYLKGTRR